MMIQTVYFDLDNTLYSYDRAHAAAYRALQQFAEDRLSLVPEQFDLLHAEANRMLTKRCGGGPAIHNRLIRAQIILELAGLPILYAPQMAERYWNTFLDHMEAEPGVMETLEALKAAGLQIGVGTNMTADWQYEKLRRLSLLPLIDLLVTSEEVNAEKPDSKLFALCAEKAGVPIQACAFVGDSLQKDAVGAKTAGMLGIWYHPTDAHAPATAGIWEISSLSELPKLLMQIS